MAKKEVIYQGLADLRVSVEDSSFESPNYFRVSKLASEFTSGINTFKFKGNPSVFNDGSVIYIEILDSNGEPIYYETKLDLESQQQGAIVSIFINQNTAPGEGYVIICGSATRDENGNLLDSQSINVRWTRSIYIDPSKRNTDEIIFETLPEIFITNSTGSYTNQNYLLGNRIVTASNTDIQYSYRNNTPALYDGTLPFLANISSAEVRINYSNLTNIVPALNGTLATTSFTSSISYVTGSTANVAVLTNPIEFEIQNSNSKFRPTSVLVTSASLTYVQSASISTSTTENSHNLATVYFSNLQPQVGTVARIRSYYRSAGIGEYILSNETDISNQADEFGFTPNTVTASFFINTIQRNDRLDFKFEFVNPIGSVSKQVVESLNNLFLGGNTYIGGDDNLLTGSLYVAGATGTGVHISGKGSAAMVRSIGYLGFQNALSGAGSAGFVIYSGSVQPLLSAAESYSGVGLELVANSASYFRYTTAGGGNLDVRTTSFFLGISGSSQDSYISSSNGAVTIYSQNFAVSSTGVVSASALYVAKNVGGTEQVMIDTTNAILDATNLGRSLYNDVTEHTITGANQPIGEFIFQGLKNEFKYIISLRSKIDYTSGPGSLSLLLIRKLKFAATGSSTSDDSFYDNWQLIDSVSTSILSRNSAGTSSKTHSEDQSYSFDLSSPSFIQYQGKLMKMELSASLSGTPSGTGYIKFITAIGTRGIGASWNQSIGNVSIPPFS
jgi:hypothetical protein